jgi:hypothetical protein
MWEHIDKAEQKDIGWLIEALANDTAILVTDGSYDRKRAPTISGAGWMIVCTKSHKTLRGSFYEISHSASAYRGELLGLVALHTLVWGIVTFYNLDAAKGLIVCDNEGALYKSSYRPLRIKNGAKQADLLRALRSLKLHKQFQFRYQHVDSHQDKYKTWRQLSLLEQLNVKVDELAKSAVARSRRPNLPDRGRQLLPLEKIAVFVDNKKMTTDVGKEVRFYLGKEEARSFYTKTRQIVNGVNKGGLGWSNERFEAVDWWSLHKVLENKPDMFGLWLSKQQAGVCATRYNIARIQDLLDDKCPNCQLPRERSNHLNHCPDHGRTLLFKDSVASLDKWMNDKEKTDAELAYFLEKYLLFRGSRSFASLGPMSPRMKKVAASQDLIGWDEFLHGKVSLEILDVQRLHCATYAGMLNGDDWMKKFISHLIHISHSQWILRNFTLHDTTRGYLRLQDRKDVLAQIEQLADCDPDKIPEGSKFLLEMDFDSLYDASYEKQSYWVRAMQAARKAGRRTAGLLTNRGASHRRRAAQRRALKPVIDNSELEKQLSIELGLIPPTTRRRPHPAGEEAQLKSNKRYKKPD